MDNPADIVQIIFRSNFFFQDSLERNRFYKTLSNKKGADNTKLVYLAMLSIETLLKAIFLLTLPISTTDKKISKILMSLGHGLYNLYLKTGYNNLTEDQINLLKQWDKYGVKIRYSTDAFFLGLETKGTESNQKLWEKEEKKRKIEEAFLVYEGLYQNLLDFYKKLLENVDKSKGLTIFNNLINEECSLGVSTSHHCCYKENYF